SPAVTIGLWPSRDERGVRRPRRRAAHPHAPPRPAGTAGTTFQGGKPTVPTATALPSTLRARLTALARRIRRLRLLRGVSLLVLALVLPAAGLFATDAWLGLPLPALRGALAALAGGAVLAAVLGLVLPLRRKPDPGALAALIEEKYPELGERLTSTVELAGGRDEYHGSAHLIALLLEETAEHARALAFPAAAPAGPPRRLGAAAGVVLILGLTAAAGSEPVADFGRRLLTSWFTQDVSPPPGYALHVTPGDVITARGRPLTLSVRLQQH